MASCSALSLSRKMLQAQFSRDLNVRHICDEIDEKSSKIVPLDAPLFSITYRVN